MASDYGGPRKEFFNLILHEIHEKFFKDGLKDFQHFHASYRTIGIVMALSMLQNGKLPCFLEEWQLKDIFESDTPHTCLSQVRDGLRELGIFQVVKKIPGFISLFRRSETDVLTIRKLQALLSPQFSEDGTNRRKFEGEVYTDFIKYLREAASGRRNNISLSKILQFVTGEDEEPVLGYKLHPSIEFVTSENGSFLPSANTCINMLKLPIPTGTALKPSTEDLHKLYDYAFANAYFGLS